MTGPMIALREVGFSGASAREIARRAGYNQSLVSYHFSSVTDLLLSALDDTGARRMAAHRGVLDHSGTLSDFVDSARSILVEDLAGSAPARSTPAVPRSIGSKVSDSRDHHETEAR